jgi:hypothetical protein
MEAVTLMPKCPFCGGALELVEGASRVWSRLVWMQAVHEICQEREKRDVRRFVDYRGRRFNWSGMMAELYRLYSLTLESGDRLNTSSPSLSRRRSPLQPASGSPIIALFESIPSDNSLEPLGQLGQDVGGGVDTPMEKRSGCLAWSCE